MNKNTSIFTIVTSAQGNFQPRELLLLKKKTPDSGKYPFLLVFNLAYTIFVQKSRMKDCMDEGLNSCFNEFILVYFHTSTL